MVLGSFQDDSSACSIVDFIYRSDTQVYITSNEKIIYILSLKRKKLFSQKSRILTFVSQFGKHEFVFHRIATRGFLDENALNETLYWFSFIFIFIKRCKESQFLNFCLLLNNNK
ncbi:unnamed protein product [Arabidopsis halleri]